MELIRLKATNYLGWKDLDLDFSDKKGMSVILAALDNDPSKSNGVGKSSIIQAIMFCLYGESRGEALDDMIHNGAEDGFHVTLTLQHNDKEYSVERKKKFGMSQKCTVKCDKKNLGSNPVEILGLPNLEIMSNTVYSKQDNLPGFVLERPSVQKDILQQIFNLDMYAKLEAKAKEIASQAGADIIKLDASLTETKAVAESLPPVDIDVLESEIATAKAGLADAQKKKEQSTQALEAVNTSLSAAMGTKQAAIKANEFVSGLKLQKLSLQRMLQSEKEKQVKNEKRLADLEKQSSDLLNKYDAAMKAVRECMQGVEAVDLVQLSTMEATVAKLTSSLAATISTLEYKMKEIEAFQGMSGVCPHCKNPITEAHKDEIVAPLLTECEKLVADKEIGENALSEATAFLKDKKAKRDIYQKALNTEALAKRDVAHITTAHNSVKDQILQLQGIVYDTSDIESQIQKIDETMSGAEEADITAVEKQIHDCVTAKNNLTSAIYVAEGHITQFNTKLLECERRIGTYEAYLAAVEKAKAALAEHAATREALVSHQKIYELLAQAFGSEGIPYLVIENKLAMLQAYVNDMLAKLSDGTIQLKIHTTKVSNSTGVARDTLQFKVIANGVERNLSTFSGGEAMRVFLAIRLALAHMLSLKYPVLNDLFIVDEIPSLDDHGLDAFAGIIKEMAAEYKNILLVSHIPRLKNSFDNAIILSCEEKGVYHG